MDAANKISRKLLQQCFAVLALYLVVAYIYYISLPLELAFVGLIVISVISLLYVSVRLTCKVDIEMRRENPILKDYDLSRDAIMVLDGDTFIYANDSTRKLFGAELVGYKPTDFSPEFQREVKGLPLASDERAFALH